ncbi:MAG: hypothetical protein AAF847_08410 [Bacteroidota bacterium]
MMKVKHLLYLPILIVLLVLGANTELHAQKKKKKSSKVDEYFDESGGLIHRLWFGGSINPNFRSFNGVTEVFLGISPMVGVKILENDDRFSIGPRVSLTYQYIRFPVAANQVQVTNILSYSVGAFARYKVLPRIFPHAEIEFENIGFPDGANGIGRVRRENLYVGAGYNSGGLLGYEVLVLYNLNVPNNSLQSPFDIRFGLTYKF